MSNDNLPPQEVQEAFLDDTSRLIRRIEVYESDMTTPWKPELWSSMLIGGNVSCDYSRDERRNFDVELDNSDGELDPEAGNLWYDKVFRIMFGIQLNQTAREPRVLIMEEYNSVNQGFALKQLLSSVGVNKVHFNPMAALWADIEDFDVLISVSSQNTQKLTLLTEAYNKGKGIITFSTDTTAGQLPLLITAANASLSTDSGDRSFAGVSTVSESIALGWQGWSIAGPQSYRKVLSVPSDVIVVANTTDATNGLSPGVLAKKSLGGQRWVHVMQNKFDNASFSATGTDTHKLNFASMIKSAITWVDNFTPLDKWETSLGWFLADNIADADELRDRVKITGRDFTKKCIQSKLTKATTFLATQTIDEIIAAVAANAGVTRMNIPNTGVKLGKDQTWERDTSRWDIIKEIAQANSYQVYFDYEGYLTLKPMNDPLLTPPSLILNTGPRGNLVSRGARTSDTELFNHVTVVGESSDSKVPLVFGEAFNTNPNSPSAISKIGERTRNESSALVTSELQATQLAQQLLAVSSLEEFELDFTSIMLPWAEPGDIIELQDDDDYWGPSRYLLSSLGFPLDLSPMTGNGKRVTKVG